MVSGIVRPPALELANRDLIESHLHAVWLAESGQNLEEDIPHVLDLSIAQLPIRKEIEANLSAGTLVKRATVAMLRILESVSAELNTQTLRGPRIATRSWELFPPPHLDDSRLRSNVATTLSQRPRPIDGSQPQVRNARTQQRRTP